MAIEPLNLPTMPSGIPVGHELSESLLAALHNHAGVPLEYYPLIEEGTYEDFKACVFRVLSQRICDVELDDMVQDCHEQHIVCSHQQREWRYVQRHCCVTTVEMRFQTTEQCAVDLREFFHFLAKKYHFHYNKICVSRPARRTSLTRDGIYHVWDQPTNLMELEVEILWRYWT